MGYFQLHVPSPGECAEKAERSLAPSAPEYQIRSFCHLYHTCTAHHLSRVPGTTQNQILHVKYCVGNFPARISPCFGVVYLVDTVGASQWCHKCRRGLRPGLLSPKPPVSGAALRWPVTSAVIGNVNVTA
jgi:hypothetical protein